MFGLCQIAVAYTESSGSEVSMQARGWLMGFKMFRVCWEWSDVFRNGQMCSGMVFAASGMLTKQTLMQHPFRNAPDGFRNAVDGLERPGMGSGLIRNWWGLDCE